MRTIVLGAGVIGVTAAFWLHRSGHDVTVIERRDAAGDGTSWGNGAMLHPCSVQPWAAPGMPALLLRWMGQEDAPMLVRPRALPRILPWGAAYLRACTARAARATTLENLALALETLDAMGEIRAETGVAYDRAAGRVVKLFDTVESRDRAADEHRFMAEAGLVMEVLDRDAVAALDPAFAAVAERIGGGLRFPQTEIGDCAAFTKGLAAWLAARGVAFSYGTEARAVRVAGGRVAGVATDRGDLAADHVVVALATESRALLRPLGLAVPVLPVKGVSLTIPRSAWPEAPRVAVMHADGKFALTPVGERLRIAGSAEIGADDPAPAPARIAAMLGRAAAMFPPIADAARDPGTVSWAGFRPVTPHGRPLVGPTRIPGLWLDTGHGHMGWTMAAGSGRRLAALIGGANAARAA